MRLQKLIAVNKFIFNRGYSYVGMLGIGFLVASELQRHPPFDSISLYFLFPLGIWTIWLVGVVDMKFKFYAEEARYGTVKNPFWNEFKKGLRGKNG